MRNQRRILNSQHQVEWLHQQQRSLTPERFGGYQRDSSTKTSRFLWSRSPTSDCRPIQLPSP